MKVIKALTVLRKQHQCGCRLIWSVNCGQSPLLPTRLLQHCLSLTANTLTSKQYKEDGRWILPLPVESGAQGTIARTQPNWQYHTCILTSTLNTQETCHAHMRNANTKDYCMCRTFPSAYAAPNWRRNAKACLQCSALLVIAVCHVKLLKVKLSTVSP